MMENQKHRKWERWPQRLLLGKTAALVGVGAISEEIAIRCQAFGMNTIGVSESRANARGFDRILPRSRLVEAAGESDFLIAVVPYARETHHLINGHVFSAMRKSSVFINIARGDVVDEAALIHHLQNGKIAGAGLDVYAEEPPAPDNPLWDMANVIMTPRIGGMSDIYAQQALPLLIENMHAYLEGRPEDIRNIVRNLAMEKPG
jgi:phosphoglycerate dehydrogenase-like enzyme